MKVSISLGRRRQMTLLSLVVAAVLMMVQAGLKDRDLQVPFLQQILDQPTSSSVPVLGAQDQISETDPASQSAELYKVIKVVDGDTIRLDNGQTVRYIGIDTPETVHPTKGVECFGQEAKVRNIELVLNKTVRLEKDVSETDRYGRWLRYVYVDDTLINRTLVAEGFAVSSSYPPDIAKQSLFQDAQQSARSANVGLWSGCPERD
jgi:endonuclease YncB( thermonuclease family)